MVLAFTGLRWPKATLAPKAGRIGLSAAFAG
jgi:hypothetical protein